LRALRRGVLGAACAALVACPAVACSSSPGPDAGAEVQTLGPVPAPDGLVAHGSMATPDATWAKARQIVGGPAAFFPQSFGGVVASFLGLPVTSAVEIDGNVPAHVAVGAPTKQGFASFAAAMHVKAGERFLDQLTKGAAARYTSTLDPATHIAVLSPKTGANAQVAVGVLGNYLVFARSSDDLMKLGPYAARTLPTLPPATEDIVIDATEQALAGPMQARLKAAWLGLKEQAAGMRAPVLFGDRVDSLLDVIGDLSSARFAVVLDKDAVHTHATLKPKADGGAATTAAAAMLVGDAKPLLDMPAATQLAILMRASKAGRDAAAPAQAAGVTQALDPEFPAAERDALTGLIRAEGDAVGDWFALGVGLTPTGPQAYARAPVVDSEKMSKALADLFAFGESDAVKSRLKARGLALTTKKTVVENVPGDVERVRFAKAEARPEKAAKDDKKAAGAKAAAGAKTAADAQAAGAAPGEPRQGDAIDLLYQVQKDEVIAAVGLDAKPAFDAALKAKTEENLAGDAAVKGFLGAVGSQATFVLFVDPARLVAARLGKPAPGHASPMVLSFGKAGADLVGRIDVSSAAVQELIRDRGAF
jgi:hypothetical protein